jgi:hypothetical protein
VVTKSRNQKLYKADDERRPLRKPPKLSAAKGWSRLAIRISWL